MIMACAFIIVGIFREGEDENSKVLGFERTSLGRKLGIILVLMAVLSIILTFTKYSQQNGDPVALSVNLCAAIVTLVIGIYFSLHDFKGE